MIHQASGNEQSSRFTKLLRRSLDGDKDLLFNNILELTINDDAIEVAIILYNELC